MKTKKKKRATFGLSSKKKQFKNSKETNMRNNSEVYEDSLEEMEEQNAVNEANIVRRPPGTTGVKTGKTRGPDWSPEETEYIVQTCESSEKVNHELLNEIASMLNKYVHNNKDVRSGSGIWWMLKRGQEKGKFKTITIPGGAPKNPAAVKPLPPVKNIIPAMPTEPRLNVRGAVDRAIAAPTNSTKRQPVQQVPVMPQPSAKRQAPQMNTQKNSGRFFVVVENSDGKVVKVQTKFNNYEEFIFAVT